MIKSGSRCHWGFSDGIQSALSFPAETEVCCWLEGDFNGLNLFLIGFGLTRIEYRAPKVAYLNAVGCAIYVAVFDLFCEADSGSEKSKELDVKETVVPRGKSN